MFLQKYEKTRLFTYVVAFDGGNAPNPYGGVCSLAICKPAIRRVAEKGDIIVGLEQGGTRRIIYCMQVTEKLEWSKYIDICRTGTDVYPQIEKKIPRKNTDYGDCIWRHEKERHEPLPSWSRHDAGSYGNDVEKGRFVLLSDIFWYFGDGLSGGINPYLPEDMPRPKRGHISSKNNAHIDDFIAQFNGELKNLPLVNVNGIYGKPTHRPDTDSEQCARCRVIDCGNENMQEER